MSGNKWQSVIVIVLSLALLITGCMFFNPGGDDVVHRVTAEIRDDYVGEGVFVKEVPFVFERAEYYNLGENAAEVEAAEIIWDEKVKFIDDKLAEMIIQAEAGIVDGRLVLEIEESMAIYDQNDILVHVEKQVAYKVESKKRTQAVSEYILVIADIEEVIEDIDIPEQTVEFNDDNLAAISEDIDLNIVSNFRHVFRFENKKYFNDQITVNGTLTLVRPSLDIHYRLGTRGDRGNFDIAFTASEEFELEITGELRLDRNAEIKVATYGVDIGRLGQCSVDLYLVLDVKGNISFFYTIDQGASIRTGVRGEKGRVFPRWGTVNFYFTPESYFDVEGQVDGQLTVKAGAKAGLKLRLLGYNVLALDALFAVRAEAELEVQLTAPYERCLTLEIDALLAANATLFDRQYQIYSRSWLIYEYASPGCNGEEETGRDLETGEQALSPDISEDNDDLDPESQKPVPVNGKGHTLNVNASSLGVQPILLLANIKSSTGHGGTTSFTIPSIEANTNIHLLAPQYIGSGSDRVRFQRWSGDVESNDLSIVFSMTNNKKVTAHYVSDPDIVVSDPDYSLTVNSSGNDKHVVNISSNTGHSGKTNYQLFDFTPQAKIHLEAPEYLGSGSERKRFSSWSGAISSSNRSINLTMDDNKTVTVNYVADPVIVQPRLYTLNVSSAGAKNVLISSLTGHGGTTDYSVTGIKAGTQVYLEAPEYVGSGQNRKRFAGWSGASSSKKRAITLTMNSNLSVTANYADAPEAVTHTLEVKSEGFPGVTISSKTGHGGTTNYTRQVVHGTEVHLMAPDPPPGYFWQGWLVNGVEVWERSITIKIDRNTTVTAHYFIPG